MKKLLYTVFALVALVFISCSNKVELYSNEGETTIVYAMLDVSVDTNYFKITKSFIGNANELAHDYWASNYKYDEIDVFFTGEFVGSNEEQTIQLDTISKWIPYDPDATFYSGCYQTYYFTDKKLKEGKEYSLEVIRKSDNVVISSKTETINAFAIYKPFLESLAFTEIASTTSPVEWIVRAAPYKSTASYFEVTSYFHYRETFDNINWEDRSIKWTMGSGTEESLYNSNVTPPVYAIKYSPSTLYTLLENDEHLKNNSPFGVKREFQDFEFTITAIGKDMYNYYLVTNSTSAIQDVPNYSNIENGIGLMSSRVTIYKNYKLAEQTRKTISERFKEYNFYYTPGN